MNNDTKHVLTILGFVCCFGAGYFVCKAENKDILKIGEKFSAVSRIEDAMQNKEDIFFENEEKAVESAINAYYKESSDKYFSYELNSDSDDIETEDKPDYADKYTMIDNICYINSSHFSLSGIQGLLKAFKDDINPDGYIIDLRNNTGGYTSNSTGALVNFIGSMDIGEYHYNDGRTGKISTSMSEKKTDKKVVILVNERTASASEIFTSAMMQFYDDVTVIGTKTYGKGTFQEDTITSKKGEKLHYTAGYYTVGDWQCYDGIGISPDIELEMKYDPDIICTDDDLQLNKAIEIFNN